MDFLIGLGLLVWAIVVFVWGQFFAEGLTSQDLIQMSVAVVGGLIIIAPKLYGMLVNIDIPKPEKDKKKEEPQPCPFNIDPMDSEKAKKEYNDYKALNYLRDRASELGSKESFELVIKLQSLIFSSKEFKDEK